MEKSDIGTDASIPAYINNICERKCVQLGSGRTLVPTNLGIVLAHGYCKVDPELVLPRARAAIEEQCTHDIDSDSQHHDAEGRELRRLRLDASRSGVPQGQVAAERRADELHWLRALRRFLEQPDGDEDGSDEAHRSRKAWSWSHWKQKERRDALGGGVLGLHRRQKPATLLQQKQQH